MKKTLCLMLSLALILAMSIPVFAEGGTESTPNTELSGTIRMTGPGLFSDVGPDGTAD